MTDFDEAISNGLTKAINKPITLLKCYFHLTKNIKKHLKLGDKDLQSRIIGHIKFISRAYDSKDFLDRFKLVKSEWEEMKNKNVTDFAKYFAKII